MYSEAIVQGKMWEGTSLTDRELLGHMMNSSILGQDSDKHRSEVAIYKVNASIVQLGLKCKL